MEENQQDNTGRKLREQSLDELEKMQRVISDNERIKEDILEKAAEERRQADENKRTNRRATCIFAAALLLLCSCSLAAVKVVKPMQSYAAAVNMMDEGQYDGAIASFERMRGYKNSDEMISECRYRKAGELLAQGKTGLALIQYSMINGYLDSTDIINGFIGKGEELLSAGDGHSVALNSIGRVLAAGDNTYGQCNVEYWNGITAVSAGKNHTLGLCADGSVVAVGNNDYGQCNVSDWHNIAYIYAAGNTSYGVRNDGSVVAVGDNSYGQCNVANDLFTNVVKIVGGGEYAAALKSDGSVVLTGNTQKLETALQWSNVTDLAATGYTLCALCSDGTVKVSGDIASDVYKEWGDVKSIAAGNSYVIGIKADGQVVSTSSLPENLKDSLYINCGNNHILALKSSGKVFAVGKGEKGECDVDQWRDVLIN